jgi:uncharacterized protein
MNVEVRDRSEARAVALPQIAIADCDIHHSPKDITLLYPYLERRWQRHIEEYGLIPRQAYQAGPAYVKGQPDASRRDAWPPNGGRPGSDLAFMAEQHLGPNNVELGVLNMIRPHPGAFPNLDLSAAVCRAVNDWQIAEWTQKDKRLKASILVPYEDGQAAVSEIERCAGHPDFVQVLLLSRTVEPMGQRRYWPIYEAAARAQLPVGVHAFGFGGSPASAGGWPSYYIEDMVGHAQSAQNALTSLVIEGVFERFVDFRLVLIETGFAWVPPLCWRLDKIWKKLRSETPHLKRPPSEYIRDRVWLTTQPMEEPEVRKHLSDTIAWIGWDKLLFASDYPHWDYDEPARALALPIDNTQRTKLFIDNAKAVYRVQ